MTTKRLPLLILTLLGLTFLYAILAALLARQRFCKSSRPPIEAQDFKGFCKLSSQPTGDRISKDFFFKFSRQPIGEKDFKDVLCEENTAMIFQNCF